MPAAKAGAAPTVRFEPVPTAAAAALRAGGPDANGLPPERAVSDGIGVPCRHCLRDVPEGAGYLVLGWRPFSRLQPYAETGPVFLCAEDCPAWDGEGLPPILGTSPAYMLRGYGADERIVHGTGGLAAREDLVARVAALLSDPGIEQVHLRSAVNGCYQCRAVRA